MSGTLLGADQAPDIPPPPTDPAPAAAAAAEEAAEPTDAAEPSTTEHPPTTLTDDIHKGHYVQDAYRVAPHASVVIADGSHLHERSSGRAVHLATLCSYLAFDATGPQADPANAANTDLGWYWVGSEGAGEELGLRECRGGGGGGDAEASAQAVAAEEEQEWRRPHRIDELVLCGDDAAREEACAAAGVGAAERAWLEAHWWRAASCTEDWRREKEGVDAAAAAAAAAAAGGGEDGGAAWPAGAVWTAATAEQARDRGGRGRRALEPAQAEERERWHWTQARGGLPFEAVTYPGADGRQSSRVDAKVQALLRRKAEAAARGVRRGGPETLHVVLLSGDGDHADHLWRAAEEFLLYDYFAAGGTKVNLKKIASRHVKVWVVGRSASISKKLRRYFPSDMLRKESRKGGRLTAAAQADLGEGDELSIKVRVQHVERLYAAGGLVGGSENRPTVLATAGAGASLAGFVESVLPRYAVQFEKLVHNKGLHAFLAAAWKESCGPRVLIVDGATGCGKSTQIPQLLYDMHCYKVHEGSGGREDGGGAAAASRRRRRRRPRILVTQPRRVACVNIAQQVLRERAARRMAWDVEEEAQAGGTQPVGYHIGGRKTSTPETPIVYCTAGVMLKKLVHADDEHWDVVVLDEVHERTVEYDLALALLLRPQTLTEARTVVIMSATLAGLSEELQSYVAQRLRSRGGDDGGGDWFADPLFTQTFDITRGTEDYGGFADMAEGEAFARYAACGGGGGRHAVPVEYLDEIVPVRHRNWRHILNAPPTGAARAPAIWTARLRYVKEFVFDSLVLPALREEAREEVVLVFLPALALIKEFRVHIISKLKEHGYSEEDCPTHVLHGKVGHDEQQAAIQAKERVRVLLATNVAESSITIEDATTVVDLCLSKLQKLTGLSDKLLTFERTTKDSCEQRRGRVGRVRDGRCFRMITEEEWRQAKPVRSPDMDRCALHDTLLSVLNRFEGTAFEKDPASLLQQCLSPPNENKIFETLRNLETTRACEKKAAGWKLLPLGRLLHSLSVSLDLALFITWASLFSHRLGCLAADYAAMASSTFDVLLDPTDSTKACSEGALTYLSVVKRSDTVHARTRVGGHHFPSDLVTDLNFLHQYRRWRTDPFRHGAEVRALCARWSLNATALAEVEEKAAELRRTMHRHRPLLPPLPRTAEAGAAAALAAAQGSGARGDETVRVIEMLRAEGLRLAEADVPPLLFLHAAVFRRRAFEGRREMASTYSVRFTPTADDRENLPKAAASLRRVLRGALRMLRPTFEGDDHAVSVSFGNEVRGGGGGGAAAAAAAEDWLFPRQTLRAAQMDKCWREVVMERRIVRIDVDIPRYGFKVFPSEEEAGGGDGGRERVMLRSGSAVNPLVLPVSYGCAVRLYPTTSELHESKTNAGLLTRVCAGVSVLPASATQGDGVGGDDAAVRNLPDLITLLFPVAPTRAAAAAAEPEWTDEFVEAAPAEAGDGDDGDAAEEPAPDLARLAPCARASAGRLHALLGRQEGVNAHFLLDGEGSDEDNDEAADLRAEQRVFRLGAVAPEEARAAQRRDLDAVLVDVLGCGDVEGLPGMLGFPVEGGGGGGGAEAASVAAAAAVKEEGKVAEVPEWVLERAAAEEGGGGGGGYQQILHTWD